VRPPVLLLSPFDMADAMTSAIPDFSVSMPEPTEEEIAGFTDLDAVAEWADLPHRGEGKSAPDSPRGTLFELLGARGSTQPRSVAAISPADFDAVLAEWKPSGRKPPPLIYASAGLLGLACRLKAGATKRKSVIEDEYRKEKQDQLKIQELQITKDIKAIELQTQQSVSVVASPAPGQSEKRIKLATHVDQSNDSEAPLLEADVAARAYERYHKWYGNLPPKEEDITKEQLAALKTLYDSGSPPYVDLAIWGPFGRRIQKKLQMEGLIMGPDGKFSVQKLYCPPATPLGLKAGQCSALGLSCWTSSRRRRVTFGPRP